MSRRGLHCYNFSSFLNCQVLRVYTHLCMCSLQCSYHYSIFDENWATIFRRFEQIHFFFGVLWVYTVVLSVSVWWIWNMWLSFQTYIFFVLFCPFFSSFILSMHSCRCTWISTAELWVCLSQWWLFRTGDFDIALAVCGLYANTKF